MPGTARRAVPHNGNHRESDKPQQRSPNITTSTSKHDKEPLIVDEILDTKASPSLDVIYNVVELRPAVSERFRRQQQQQCC
jgi:hypoxanthine phosphoribosyltransferase